MNRGLSIRKMMAAAILAGSIAIPAVTSAASAATLGTGAASADSALILEVSVDTSVVAARGAAVAVPIRVVV